MMSRNSAQYISYSLPRDAHYQTISSRDLTSQKGVGEGKDEISKTGILQPMIKTFLQRWWVLNSLHRFCILHDGIVWANQRDFTQYVNNLMIDRRNKSLSIYPLYRIHKWLWEMPNDILAYSKVNNVIDECIDPQEGGVALMVSKHINENNPLDHCIRLSSIGRERYSWTYIIFGTDYARKIWTGVIIAAAGTLFAWQLQGVFPHNPVEVKIEYPASTGKQ